MIPRDVHPAFLAASNSGGGQFSGAAAGTAGAERLPPSASATKSFLALDQSSTLIGWACGASQNDPPKTGTFGLPTIVGPNGEKEVGAVGHQIQEFLREMHAKHGVTHIVYEAVHFDTKKKNADMFGQLTGVEWIIRTECVSLGITCIAVIPGDWRQHFLGYRDSRAIKGQRDKTLKTEAVDRAKKRGWSVQNHHEADACGMWSWLMASHYADFAAKSDPNPLFRGAP